MGLTLNTMKKSSTTGRYVKTGTQKIGYVPKGGGYTLNPIETTINNTTIRRTDGIHNEKGLTRGLNDKEIQKIVDENKAINARNKEILKKNQELKNKIIKDKTILTGHSEMPTSINKDGTMEGGGYFTTNQIATPFNPVELQKNLLANKNKQHSLTVQKAMREARIESLKEQLGEKTYNEITKNDKEYRTDLLFGMNNQEQKKAIKHWKLENEIKNVQKRIHDNDKYYENIEKTTGNIGGRIGDIIQSRNTIQNTKKAVNQGTSRHVPTREDFKKLQREGTIITPTGKILQTGTQIGTGASAGLTISAIPQAIDKSQLTVRTLAVDANAATDAHNQAFADTKEPLLYAYTGRDSTGKFTGRSVTEGILLYALPALPATPKYMRAKGKAKAKARGEQQYKDFKQNTPTEGKPWEAKYGEPARSPEQLKEILSRLQTEENAAIWLEMEHPGIVGEYNVNTAKKLRDIDASRKGLATTRKNSFQATEIQTKLTDGGISQLELGKAQMRAKTETGYTGEPSSWTKYLEEKGKQKTTGKQTTLHEINKVPTRAEKIQLINNLNRILNERINKRNQPKEWTKKQVITDPLTKQQIEITLVKNKPKKTRQTPIKGWGELERIDPLTGKVISKPKAKIEAITSKNKKWSWGKKGQIAISKLERGIEITKPGWGKHARINPMEKLFVETRTKTRKPITKLTESTTPKTKPLVFMHKTKATTNNKQAQNRKEKIEITETEKQRIKLEQTHKQIPYKIVVVPPTNYNPPRQPEENPPDNIITSGEETINKPRIVTPPIPWKDTPAGNNKQQRKTRTTKKWQVKKQDPWKRITGKNTYSSGMNEIRRELYGNMYV